MTIIKNYKLNKKLEFGSDLPNDWPVIYLLKNSKDIYIGETKNFSRRMNEHIKNPKKKDFSYVYRLYNESFNKSATLDIESKLIEYFSADGMFKVKNDNNGMKDHNYYNKSYYRGLFDDLWEELKSEGLVKNSKKHIENLDIFKMSPYKSLSGDQYKVVEAIEDILTTHKESINIVNGEPGTGKTIVAIYLMKYLQSLEKNSNKRLGIVIPMTSLRKTIKKVFRNVDGLNASMVLSPYDVHKNDPYDILIVDEAHRLAKRKNLPSYKNFDDINIKFGMDKHKGTQLDWIMKSASHKILFYDENQTIKPTDIDNIDTNDTYISYKSNNDIDSTVQVHELTSQFRVKAGKDYIKYIENILNKDIKEKKVFNDYEFMLFDDVDEMVNLIKDLDKEFGLCRTVSGYCWEWNTKDDKSYDPSKFDILIEDYKYRWNSSKDDWINSDNAVNEIGCIHKVQGYDLNYCAVIIGEDIIYRDDKIIYNPNGYKDINAKDLKLSEDQMKEYILNIYKVLLTRGIKGTYVYVCDKQLREYLKKFISIYSSN